jgi:GTP cyclohydrolase I
VTIIDLNELDSAAHDVRLAGAGVTQDLVAAELAAGNLLTALGLPLDTPSLKATPGRMARALGEMITPGGFTATTFPNDEGYSELVLQSGIPFRSLCEHHMLAFSGVAHVGYLPGERIVGLSKLARLVQHFAARPQVQERLTQQIGTWLDQNLSARGVGVVMSAEHSCMSVRGVRVTGTRTVTSAWFGTLREQPQERDTFLTLAGLK